MRALQLLGAVSDNNYKTTTAKFGLRLNCELCKVVKVYDGDSMTLAWTQPVIGHDRQTGTGTYTANCRLYGIDTPELRSKDEKERLKAVQCRDLLSAAVLNELLFVSTVGNTGLDKYGRPLVNLFTARGYTSERCMQYLAQMNTANVDVTNTEMGVCINTWALGNLPGCMAYYGGTKTVRFAEEDTSGGH